MDNYGLISSFKGPSKRKQALAKYLQYYNEILAIYMSLANYLFTMHG